MQPSCDRPLVTVGLPVRGGARYPTGRPLGAVPDVSRLVGLARGRSVKWISHDDVLEPRPGQRLRLEAELAAYFLGPWQWRGYAWDVLRGSRIPGTERPADRPGEPLPARTASPWR